MEPAVPAGLSFEVADLILLQSWAEFHDLRMVVELDHCGADGEYEEWSPSTQRMATYCVGFSGERMRSSSSR
jgi:hypothetical protein